MQIRTGVELADFRGSINERITLRFSRLGKRQGEDRQTMHQTIHGMRTTIKRKRERASKVQHQRLKNNSHDMRHAHKNEFNDIQARVPGLQVQPRKSYQRKSSTFRGTHFCRNMASTHNPGSWGESCTHTLTHSRTHSFPRHAMNAMHNMHIPRIPGEMRPKTGFNLSRNPPLTRGRCALLQAACSR